MISQPKRWSSFAYSGGEKALRCSRDEVIVLSTSVIILKEVLPARFVSFEGQILHNLTRREGPRESSIARRSKE